ncbi:MAG: phosphorylase [Thermoleophilia bacterium]|nr:phosphorylase [Thermoleophilia bacterium]
MGLITGTGLYELEGLEDRRTEDVTTPHGTATVTLGTLAGVPVAHVPRHGAGHARLSHQVTPRANVAAIAALGARALVSTTVCGAVDPSLELGQLIVFDDLHFPSNRLADGSLCTLFTGPEIPGRGHWIYELPFGAHAAGLTVRDGGVYGHVDGPRLNTVSEIAQLAVAGVAAVSQTGGPETVLAGEARLPFALVGFVTDHANGVMPELTPAETLARLFSESAGVFQRALRSALPVIAAEPGPPAGIVFSL